MTRYKPKWVVLMAFKDSDHIHVESLHDEKDDAVSRARSISTMPNVRQAEATPILPWSERVLGTWNGREMI